MIDPSTPIQECLKDCTPAERAALKDGKLPHVRTWGDLEVERERAKKATPKAE